MLVAGGFLGTDKRSRLEAGAAFLVRIGHCAEICGLAVGWESSYPSPVMAPLFIEPCLPTISRTFRLGGNGHTRSSTMVFAPWLCSKANTFASNRVACHDWAKQLPTIVDTMNPLPVRSAVLDGDLRAGWQVRLRCDARLLQPPGRSRGAPIRLRCA